MSKKIVLIINIIQLIFILSITIEGDDGWYWGLIVSLVPITNLYFISHINDESLIGLWFKVKKKELKDKLEENEN
jgi:hypothetical protein